MSYRCSLLRCTIADLAALLYRLKQSFEYECAFIGLSSSENIWLPRDDLIRRGFEKKVMEVDTREAQKAGLLRPLVRREIELHMADFGLEPEFVTRAFPHLSSSHLRR